MQIPEEVIEQAAKAQYEWQDGLPSWENDADGFTKAEYVSQTSAAAPVIAEWARKEALQEAIGAVSTAIPRGVEERSDAMNAIWALTEGVSDGQQ